MTSWLLEERDDLFFKPSQGTDKPLGTAYENMVGAFENDRLNEIGSSRAEAYSDAWGPIVDEVNSKSGPVQFINPGHYLTRAGASTPDEEEKMYKFSAERLYKYVEENQDLFPELADLRSRDFAETAKGIAIAAREEFNELDARSPGITNTAAQFAGSAGAFFRDPSMLLTLPMGLYSMAQKKLWEVGLIESALAAGTEAANQPAVQKWWEELGYDYTYEDFVARVGTAAGFGFVLPYGFAAGGKGISMTADQIKKGIDAFKSSGIETPASRAAARIAERQNEINDDNPLEVYSSRSTRLLSTEEYDAELNRLIDAEQGLKKLREDARVDYDGLMEVAIRQRDEEGLSDEEFREIVDAINEETGYKNIKDQHNAMEQRIKDFITEQEELAGGPKQPDADLEHQARTNEAERAVLFNEVPVIDNQAAAPVSAAALESMGGPIVGARDFDPTDLGVDAELFQYKSGGDEYGVTEALRGVTEWDQVRAGTALVFEFADGRKVVADGHQRLGLAKRIKDQDPNQDPKIHAYTLREADGWTPEEVRVVAALKNIAEGSGKPVDAAKILRVDPNKIDELNLPPQSALVRQAKDLVNLSDEVFMMVVNGVVPANYAAVVGRMIPDDPDLQEAALRVIASQEPANEFQVQVMVGQVREMGAQKMTQDGLFGEETFAESFFAERAKVLDRAMKEIRKDKAAFSNITRNAERLEAEGNVLEKSNNQRRINDEQKTLQLLQALANAKGPLSEALTAAARAARESGSYAGPTRKFIDDVRAAVSAGDLDRLTAGDVGRFIDDPGQVSPSAAKAEPEVSLFDNPAGDGVAQQSRQLENDLLAPEEVDIRLQIEQRIKESIDSFDEDAYIRLINPEGLRIPDEDVGTWTLDDMAEVDVPMTTQPVDTVDGIDYLKAGNDIYAFDGDELVGYMQKAEDGSDLNVAQEYRGRGIGGQLSFLYRSQNPKMASGGLSVAGEATARAAFRKMREMSEIKNDVDLYFERTDDSIDIPVAQLTPTRARPEGIFGSKVFMAQAARGERTKRPPIEVRANEDGTYTLRDGNSTYSVAVDAGWETIPARVLSDDEYAKAVQTKNINRILDPQGKDKGRTVESLGKGDNEYAHFESLMLQRQQFASFDEMIERSARNHQELNEVIDEITSELGIPFTPVRDDAGTITVPPVKKPEDVRRKLVDKYGAPEGDMNPVDWLWNITDIARSGMNITKPSDVKAVLEALNKRGYHVLDEGFKVTPAGYFDAKALVQAKDGQLMELQFWPPGMLDAKQDADLTEFGYPATYFDEKAGKEKPYVGGHKLYEIIQDREKTATKADIDRAEEVSQVIYGRVVAQLPTEFNSLLTMLGIDRRSALNKSAKPSASPAEISTDRSSPSMRPGDAAPQEPATGFQTNTEALSSDIAASDMPSTLKNLTYDTSELSVPDLDNAAKSAERYPTGRVVEDDTGELVVEMQSAAELKAEFDHDESVINRFRDCVL
jgi:GNAT superfamily N-acetyltransferase